MTVIVHQDEIVSGDKETFTIFKCNYNIIISAHNYKGLTHLSTILMKCVESGCHEVNTVYGLMMLLLSSEY